MPEGKPSSEKTNAELTSIPGISGIPTDIPPETLDFFRGLVESFNESAEGLRKAYVVLQDKFDALNIQLEETNRDLSRSLAEQERLSNYLTNILESLTSGVLVIDTGGVITLFNRGAEIITGIDGNDAVDKHYREVFDTEIPDELTPLHVLSDGAGSSHMEKTIISKSGENIPVGFSISPLLNTAGELLGAVEIFMDLRNIKALEDEISRMDKLAALGQMSATMAHKIRNPLGGIVGYAGLLGNSLTNADKGKRHIQKIIEGVEKINHIITSVLEYNSQLNLKPSAVDIGELIDDLISILKQEIEETHSSNIGFTVSQPAEPFSVEIDPEQFKIALLYIFRNAVEAIEEEGSIDVRIIPGESQMTPSCVLTAGLVRKMKQSSKLFQSRRPCSMILLTDSGTGIDEETMKNLFVPFYTTKEKGIGLGLASARKIIEAHHGEIWIESTVNSGTSVGIIIPVRSTVI